MRNENGHQDHDVHALTDLRTYMHALANAITNHPDPSLERDEAQWRIDELVEELAHTSPSARRVKSRWIRLIPLVSRLRPDLSTQQVSELINRALKG